MFCFQLCFILSSVVTGPWTIVVCCLDHVKSQIYLFIYLLQCGLRAVMPLSVVLYLSWYLIADVGAFNIDVTNPIVLRSSSQRADRRPTYFGFSLVFHQAGDDSAPWWATTPYYLNNYIVALLPISAVGLAGNIFHGGGHVDVASEHVGTWGW